MSNDLDAVRFTPDFMMEMASRQIADPTTAPTMRKLAQGILDADAEFRSMAEDLLTEDEKRQLVAAAGARNQD